MIIQLIKKIWGVLWTYTISFNTSLCLLSVSPFPLHCLALSPSFPLCIRACLCECGVCLHLCMWVHMLMFLCSFVHTTVYAGIYVYACKKMHVCGCCVCVCADTCISSPRPGEKVMQDDEFTCDLFRFLQLLCEGHNSGVCYCFVTDFLGYIKWIIFFGCIHQTTFILHVLVCIVFLCW